MTEICVAGIYVMTPVAGAVSGLLAYGVGQGMEGTHGIPAWKWLFIIEGVATVGFGFIVILLLPGIPENTAKTGSWLFPSQEERHIILLRSRASECLPRPFNRFERRLSSGMC